MVTFSTGYEPKPVNGSNWSVPGLNESQGSVLSSPEGRTNDLCNTSGESNITNSSLSSGSESDSGTPPPAEEQRRKVAPPLSPKKEADLGPDHDYEKPPYSYIALISMAILRSTDKKLLLGDIYQYCMDKFPFYKYSPDKAWRNSIRHNLSLNECFIKAGRADNGKGNYWAVHPACQEDFSKGDYRRRQARRRARKAPVNISQLPMSYRYNMGYVPMTAMPTSMGSMSGNPYTRTSHYHPYAYPTHGYHHSYQSPSPSASSGIQNCSPPETVSPSTSPVSTGHLSPAALTSSPYMTGHLSTSPLAGGHIPTSHYNTSPQAMVDMKSTIYSHAGPSQQMSPPTTASSSSYPTYFNMHSASDYLLPPTSPQLPLTLRDMPALRDALSGLF